MEFLIVDGKIYPKNDINLTQIYRDETFRLSQSVWFGFGGIPLLEENIELLFVQISELNLTVPKELSNTRELFRVTKRMLNKNKFYRTGLIHLVFLWHNNGTHSLISSEAFHTSDFPLRKEGLLLNYFKQKKYSQNIYNRYLFFNEMLWEVALKGNENTLFQNTIITNEKEVVCECTFNNIYLIKGTKISTPSLKTGCFEDLTRNIILKIGTGINLKVEETDDLKINDLFKADEIFLASETEGIQWVLGIEYKRFVHHYSIVIHRKLNEYLKEKVV